MGQSFGQKASHLRSVCGVCTRRNELWAAAYGGTEVVIRVHCVCRRTPWWSGGRTSPRTAEGFFYFLLFFCSWCWFIVVIFTNVFVQIFLVVFVPLPWEGWNPTPSGATDPFGRKGVMMGAAFMFFLGWLCIANQPGARPRSPGADRSTLCEFDTETELAKNPPCFFLKKHKKQVSVFFWNTKEKLNKTAVFFCCFFSK